MFSGEQAHQLDAKNRIRIPVRFKAELGDRYVFCKSAARCINVMPQSTFEKMAQEFSKISMFDVEGQEALTEFMSSFYQAEEDSQGRVILPQALREYAGIEKDIITVGVYDKLEIWSADIREKKRKEKTFGEYMSVLAQRTAK